MKTNSQFQVVAMVDLPDQYRYLAEGGDTVNVRVVVQQKSYRESYDGPQYELVVTATSIVSMEEATEALKQWADYIASGLDHEIGYGR